MGVINDYNTRFEVTTIDLPDTDTPFESVFFKGQVQDSGICKETGRCNLSCISGRRVLQGTVKFNRAEHEMLFDPSYLFITFASGNNTTGGLHDFDKDVGNSSTRTGTSNARLDGNAVKFGSTRIEEAS